MKNIITFLFAILVSYPLLSQGLQVISWNIESGGATIESINQIINDNLSSNFKDVDIWGFSEVSGVTWAKSIKENLENKISKDYWYVLGNSGSADRLMILFDQDKFSKIDEYELYHINIGGRVRAPLVVHLKSKQDNTELLFMVNHLYRGSATARQQQAQLLDEWVQDQDLPVIAVGDYNFDYSLKSNGKKGNTSFKIFTASGNWKWIPPEELIMSQCNTYYNSILDFIFINDDAENWKSTSSIVVIDGDCPDNHLTPDHRPVKGVFEF